MGVALYQEAHRGRHDGFALSGSRRLPCKMADAMTVTQSRNRVRMGSVLTLIADRDAGGLDPGLITAVRDAVSGGPATILSDWEAVDIPLPAPPDMDAIRAAIATAPVDVIATDTATRRKRLLIADMDSTIITAETLDELADFAGIKDRIAVITARAMNGELDFKDALRERVAMLQGLPVDALERTWQRITLTPGARELVATMRANGAFTALVSGGFTFFTSRVAALLGFHLHRANLLLDDGTALTGAVAEPILDRGAKLDSLRGLSQEHGLAVADTLAVGDGANDLDMLGAAGLGVAFHAKPIVAASAQARVDHADLRALLFAQGYRAADFITS
jgi:phosphoserine phosphatase